MSRRNGRARRVASLTVTLLLLSGVSAPLPAQDARIDLPAQPPGLAQCTYDRCALRLDRGFWGERVREGIDGPALPVGFTGRTLTGLVGRVPTARIVAERGERQRIRGNIALTIGAAVLGTLISATTSPDAEITSSHWIGLVSGGAATIYGGVQLNLSAQSFSRAVWLFNREIPR